MRLLLCQVKSSNSKSEPSIRKPKTGTIISGIRSKDSAKPSALEIEQRTYKTIDTFIGNLLKNQPKDCLVVLVSDHSAVSYGNSFDVADALKQAGLLVTRKTTHGEEIVLEKSKAIFQRSVYVYVNLKGRNPGGIVNKKDYEKIMNEIIAALYDYTDPKTKCKPVALALRKDDAEIVGLCGEGVGDVVVAAGRGFGLPGGGEVHGNRLPGGQYGGKKMKTLLLFSGPGIKKDCKVKRTVSLKDIAPTIAHLMEFPVPRDTEGGIIYQMLENKVKNFDLIKKTKRSACNEKTQ